MALRCVYVDLDGTLLGPGGSLFAAPGGGTTPLGAKAVEACLRADVELVIMTGRRQSTAAANARIFGQTSYIFEIGSAFVIEDEEHWLTGDWVPDGAITIHDRIEIAGAPALLLDRYRGQLEYHDPWHLGRDVSHLFRGLVDVVEADELLAEHGHAGLRLVDNGAAHRRSADLAALEEIRVYHLLPAGASKATAVAAHMRARGLAPQECIAVGDSREDLAVAGAVGTFWMVANGLEKDAGMGRALASYPNVRVCEEAYGAGVYEALVTTLKGAA